MQAELAVCMQPCEGAPAGADARVDAEHERVRAEIEKLNGLAGDAPDWQAVEQLGCELLTARSKDLTIAAFVAAARLERTGWDGLLEGAELLAGLVRAFGADLYPQRPRARANALAWWVDYTATRIAKLGAREAALLTPIKATLSALQRVVNEWLGDDAPPFGELLRALDRALLEPSPVAAPIATPVQPVAVASAPEELALPTDEVGIGRFLRVQSTKLVALARARMEAEPSDARAYRWLRTGLWLGWEGAPPEGKNGRTALAPPLTSSRGELQHAQNQQRWRDVVCLSEALLAIVPHWLELGYVCAQALRELGPQYAQAREVVERETRGLHARMPELAARSFRDGTPFASPEALQWLNAGARVEVEPALAPEPKVDSLDGLVQSLQRAPSPRALFVQRCQLAQRFVAAGEGERAKFVYRGLLEDVDAFALERWEPALALDVVQPLCALSEGRTPAGVKDAELAALYARLARLAPWLAPKRSTTSASASR
ncbi:MAG TPA: type VI secretion system protein TssA [Polyangiales bacterium]|nr:type VI secretion system protein TssA [Polyangiales bacterium]